VEERDLLDGREWVSWVADGNHLLIKVINSDLHVEQGALASTHAPSASACVCVSSSTETSIGSKDLSSVSAFSFVIGNSVFTTSGVSSSSSECVRSACMLGFRPGKISRGVADEAGCASWMHEASVAFGEYYVLLWVLKNDLGSGDERCWKLGVCVTTITVWEVALCAGRYKGALDVVSDNLIVVDLDSDV